MFVYYRAGEMIRYLKKVQEAADINSEQYRDMDPAIMVREVYNPSYYPIFEQTMKDDIPSLIRFTSGIYKKFIPYLCSELSDEITVGYRDDKYDPVLVLAKGQTVIGRICLNPYRFEYIRDKSGNEYEEEIRQLQNKIAILKEDYQQTLNEMDYTNQNGFRKFSGYFSRKKTARKADGISEDVAAAISSIQDRIDDLKAKKEFIDSSSKEIRDLQFQAALVLKRDLKMPSVEVLEELTVPADSSEPDKKDAGTDQKDVTEDNETLVQKPPAEKPDLPNEEFSMQEEKSDCSEEEFEM